MAKSRLAGFIDALDSEPSVQPPRTLAPKPVSEPENDDDRLTALRLQTDPDGPLFAVVTGDAGNNSLTGTSGNDTLSGLDGDDTLRGGGGDDVLDGGTGIDTVSYSTAGSGVLAQLNDTIDATDGDGGRDTLIDIENLTGSAFNDLLIGSNSANTLNGGLGADILIGLGGNDILVGGSGSANQLQGGTGNDDYYVSATDTLVEFSGEGFDRVFTTLAGFTLSANIEMLVYTGSGSFTGTGNDGDNTLIGGTLDDTLIGGLGADTLVGRDGNDRLFGGTGASNQLQGGLGNDDYYIEASDTLVEFDGEGFDRVFTNLAGFTLSANIEMLVYTGSGSFVGTGNDGDNTLIGGGLDDVLSGGDGQDYLVGGNGNDRLSGGAGSTNQLQGGAGDDDYYVEANDTVVELAAEGYDRVFTNRATYVMAANLEMLVFTGSGPFRGTGNAGDNTLVGGSDADTLFGGDGQDYLLGEDGNDVLSGGTGATNQLQGGTGDDDYMIDANDTVIELAAGGQDRVFTSLGRLVLSANVEELYYTGSGAFTGVGNDEDNLISGNVGNDVLSGGLGSDVLSGGGGSDTADYSLAGSGVEAFIDTATATDGDGGVDTLTGIENLLGSTFSDLLYGDTGANILDGADGDDILVGRAGNDTLRGGDGFDVADYSDATSGVIVKLHDGTASDGEGGTDTLISIEDANGGIYNDILIGSAESNYLFGSDGSDVLIGLEGNDFLSGGDGAPNQLQGGLGDDQYLVEANDTVIELAGEGFDSVATTLNTYTLRANFEELAFTGTGNFVGNGNDENNIIYGGDGDDILFGGKGDDFLIGTASCGCGGDATDTAVLSGVLADYTIEDLGGGLFSVVDNVANRDGEDVLADIDQLRFSDGSVFVLGPMSAPEPDSKGSDEPQVLPGISDDLFLLDKGADVPTVLPGISDDVFLLDKGADLPTVLPGIDDIEKLTTGFDPADQPVQLVDHMMTLGDDGFLLGPTDDIGRLHDHDGWLF